MGDRGRARGAADVVIRDAEPGDIERVRAIYAHYVEKTEFSFEEEAPSLKEMLRRWESVIALGLPYVVAVVDGAVAGYGYVTPYRARSGYRYSVENSVYVDERLAGRGIGSALLAELIAKCGRGEWRQMVAVIGGANAASVRLHAKFGFTMVGVLHEVGYKFGRWWDTTLMQRSLK